MGRTGRFTGALLAAAALVTSAAACTAADADGGGEGSASCANLFTYQGRSYSDVSPNVRFTVGEKVGTASQKPCKDSGDSGEAEGSYATENAYVVDGISSEVAIAIGETAEETEFFSVRSGSGLPPEVKEFIDR
ncbi:DUF6281 family protein [Streptomyces sp. NBC_00876]|uniref:DUF6281 family protein n=1 Tax=Streptomyces sp. NBC_00876 TaxID=2975853 RepID=UPI00386C2639|nr:DUF6281 family protein [Streptomyces sp. NBC_00876]